MSQSEKRQKTAMLQVRATPSEKELLKKRADAFGVSMAELCRNSIFNSKPKSKTDQQAISELAIARADLGRLGGLLKGWLAGSFPSSPAADQARVRTLLFEIDAAQVVVVKTVKKLVEPR